MFTSDPIAPSDDPYMFEEDLKLLNFLKPTPLKVKKKRSLKEALDYFCTDGLPIKGRNFKSLIHQIKNITDITIKYFMRITGMVMIVTVSIYLGL